MARVAKRRERQDIQLQKAESGIKVYQTAIYARLSREDNLSNSDSIENQIALLERYIDARPYLQLADIFADNGFTGTDFERPEWQRLMEAVQQRKINCIIVKDLSRLGRNYIETGEFLEKICPFFGIRFIAVNDNFDTVTAEANGQLSVSLSILSRLLCQRYFPESNIGFAEQDGKGRIYRLLGKIRVCEILGEQESADRESGNSTGGQNDLSVAF